MSLEEQRRALEKARSGKLARHAGVDVAASRPLSTERSTGSPHQRQGDRGAGDDSQHHGLPIFVRYTDLVAANIVGNWTTLLRLIDDEGFPPGVMIGPNMRAWRLDDVEEWLASRPSARKTMPEGCVPTRGRRRREPEQESATA
jgi:hypothetical protein